MEVRNLRNLLLPENRRYIPLAAFGIARGLAAMAIEKLAGPPPQVRKVAQASIQFYSTHPDGVPQPDNVVELPVREEPPDIIA